MQRKFIVTYFIIFAFLLGMMSLSRHASNKMKGSTVAFFAPVWEKILSFKYFLLHPSQPSPFSELSIEEKYQRLLTENQLLEIQINDLQSKLNEYLIYHEDLTIQPLPARVIYRSNDSWNHFLWINVGRIANQSETLIEVNSPVVLGKAIIGIIDYVGEKQSRVRLISDSRLTPSVRAARGSENDYLIYNQIEKLLQQIKQKNELLALSSLLEEFKQTLKPFATSWHLAKGILSGSVSRMGENVILKGTGFNFDFPDEKGEARDLRNGRLRSGTKEEAIAVLKVNDVLITTGMDGIFPPGFQVALVTEIEPLKEGDYFYDLKAVPIAGPMEELSLVFVLPPLAKENYAK